MKKLQPFHRSEELYQAFFENSADAIFVLDADLRIIDTNQAACDRLMYTKAELLALSAVEVNAPESRPFVMRYAELLRTTGFARGEVVHVTKHGDRIPVEINSRRISLGGGEVILTVARDVSDRKIIENRLLQSQQHFRLLFEHTGTANSFYDLTGRLVLCNQYGARLLGYADAGEIVGKTFHEIFGDERGDVFLQRMNQAVAEGTPQVHVSRFLVDSQEKWVQTSYIPLVGDDGKAIGVQLVSQDTTTQRRYEIDLNAANARLEEQVLQRTRHLEEALIRLQDAQNSIAENEKLAVLGRLSASVAHEVNNPLAAIQSSNGTIRSSLDTVLTQAVQVLSTLDGDSRNQFRELLRQSEAASREQPGAVSRSMKQNLAAELAERNLPEPQNQAEALAQLGLAAVDEGWLPLLSLEQRDAILEVAVQVSSLYRSTGIIATATGKATEFIKALRRFAYKDNAQGEPESFDLVDNLETVLLLLKGQLSAGIELVRDFQARPRVRGYPNLLLQVWSNLIQNAVQAMDETGVLTLRVATAENRAVVEVTDTGTGVPEHLREKIFEPFFTTKNVDKGTGLGLGIVTDALSHNHGSLELDSVPGKTTFRVRLPLAK